MPTLGDALVSGRRGTLATGEAYTIVEDSGEFTAMPSREYAVLRENNAHIGIEPVVSFLPTGDIDVHRPAFTAIATAMRDHPNF
jgi:hypothetical protein